MTDVKGALHISFDNNVELLQIVAAVNHADQLTATNFHAALITALAS